MKNKKSNIPTFVSAAGLACLLLVAGCSQDDALISADDAEDNSNAIRFTTAIAGFTGSDAADTPGTRTTINDEDGTGSFANGDETMIRGFIFNSTPFVEKEHPAAYNGGTWTTSMTWDEFGEGAEVSFSAFFPKRSSDDFDENGRMEINLPTNQSTPEQHAAYDWLYATAAGTKADSPIQLTFSHLMHRLTVNLSLSATSGTLTQADVDNAKVVIKNMYFKGLVAKNGRVVSRAIADAKDNFTPLKSASGNSFRVLLLPQSVTPGTPWIEITVGSRTVIYNVPATLTVLEGGKEQVVNLTLTDSGAS